MQTSVKVLLVVIVATFVVANPGYVKKAFGQLSQPAVKDILKWVCENSGKLPIPSNVHNEIQNTCPKVVGQKLTAEAGGGYQAEGPNASAPGGGGGYQAEGPGGAPGGSGGYQPRP